MIVRSELYFPDIVFEFPDPPAQKSQEHGILSSMLKAKFKKDSQKISKDPPPPTVNYSENPHWTWPGVLQSVDARLESLRSRFGVVLPMERVDIELVRRSDLVAKKGKKRSQLIATYGEDIVDAVVGLHTRSKDGTHHVKIGYYGDQYTKTESQIAGTLTHELGHVLGEFPLADIVYEEMKGYAMQALLLVKPETAVGSTGSLIHDRSRGMLAQLGQMGICEPAILAHISGVSFGEYGPLSYKDLRQF